VLRSRLVNCTPLRVHRYGYMMLCSCRCRHAILRIHRNRVNRTELMNSLVRCYAHSSLLVYSIRCGVVRCYQSAQCVRVHSSIVIRVAGVYDVRDIHFREYIAGEIPYCATQCVVLACDFGSSCIGILLYARTLEGEVSCSI